MDTPNDTRTPTNGYAYDSTPPPSSPDSTTSASARQSQRPTSLSYTPHLTLRGHSKPVSAVAFSPSGSHLASASADATIKIWDVSSGTCTATLEGHLAGISCLSWNPDGTVLASGSDDKSIRLWDVKTGKCYPTALVGHSNYIYSLAFSPKGNMLVSGSYDEAVFLWDVRTSQVMRQLPAHSDPVSGVDFVRDGTLVASCSSDGLIRIWDAGTGQCLKTLVHEDNAAVGSVRFSPDGRFVLAATLDGCLRLWSYVDGRVLKTYAGHRNNKYSLNVCFGTYGSKENSSRKERDMDERMGGIDDEAKDGVLEKQREDSQRWAFVACGDEDGKLVLWDVNSKEILQSAHGHEGPISSVDASPTSDMIATCGHDGTVKIWKQRIEMTNGHV